VVHEGRMRTMAWRSYKH